MSLTKIQSSKIVLVYCDLAENYGYYRIRTGKQPYICLSNKLLEGSEGVHYQVYQTLLNYHEAIPLDSPYRLFPMVRYFEELIPLDQKDFAELEVEPDLIFIGRASRRWSYPVYLPQTFKLIG
jgi:hypothetical protein